MIPENQYIPDKVFPPGFTLKEKLEEMGMSQKEFALRTGKPEKTITAIINGDSAITKETAIKFENVTKIPAHFWISKQTAYDEYLAREKSKNTIEEALEWAKTFPYAKMAAYGWVPKTRNLNEKAKNLLTFFRIAQHQAWENIFIKQELKVAFRISLSFSQEAPAISAWLQQGYNKALEIEVPKYNRKVFLQNLKKIKKIMAEQPDNFFEQLQKLCLQAGVIVLHTPNLPKAPIHGSTRWINETPLIQLSARYKQNDRFWFTFFHEAAHILLHGKKYIALETANTDNHDIEKEKEADEFAENMILNKNQEQEILENLPLSDEQIIYFAQKFETHPAMIIGRLQHLGYLPYSQGHHFIKPVIFSED